LHQAGINFRNRKHAVAFNGGYKNVRDIYLYNPKSIANNNRSNLLQLLLTDQYQATSKTVYNHRCPVSKQKNVSNDRGIQDLDQFAGLLS
jgi:iron complex outermembrane receptor protein